MDFITADSGPARYMRTASIVRASGVTLLSASHDGSGSRIPLWWGPVVPIEAGDLVYYFPTPLGLAVEAVG